MKISALRREIARFSGAKIVEETGWSLAWFRPIGMLHFTHLDPVPEGWSYPHPDWEAACSKSTTNRQSMTHSGRWGSMCWKRGTFRCRPGRRFPGINRWLARAFLWPDFAGRGSAVGHAQLAEGARGAPHRAAGHGPRIEEPEPLRGSHGRGGPVGHLHADVLHPRPQAGPAR